MPLITLEQVLKDDPVDSPSFEAAIEALKRLIETPELSPAQSEAFEGFRTALASRAWTDEDIKKFVDHAGSCALVALLADRIDVKPESMNTGCLAKANLFAALHMKGCTLCKLFFMLEQAPSPAKSESSN
jgi:hypothetical protein